MMLRGAAFLRVASSDAPVALAPGDRIPNGAVLELPEGADASIRTGSYREITITGPATATLCPNGEDAVWLSRGKLSAFPGTGVRPGVEVWVATPLGVVRYSDAKIDIASEAADGTRLTVTAAMAQADFLPAPAIQLRRAEGNDLVPAKAFADVQVAAGATLVAERASLPIPRLLPQLVRACSQESEGALGAARRLSEGGDAGQLGELASAHVRARRRARAACETARAAALLGPPALEGSLLAELTAADEKRNQLTPLPARR
jgi:hypothetical protein